MLTSLLHNSLVQPLLRAMMRVESAKCVKVAEHLLLPGASRRAVERAVGAPKEYPKNHAFDCWQRQIDEEEESRTPRCEERRSRTEHAHLKKKRIDLSIALGSSAAPLIDNSTLKCANSLHVSISNSTMRSSWARVHAQYIQVLRSDRPNEYFAYQPVSTTTVYLYCRTNTINVLHCKGIGQVR